MSVCGLLSLCLLAGATWRSEEFSCGNFSWTHHRFSNWLSSHVDPFAIYRKNQTDLPAFFIGRPPKEIDFYFERNPDLRPFIADNRFLCHLFSFPIYSVQTFRREEQYGHTQRCRSFSFSSLWSIYVFPKGPSS